MTLGSAFASSDNLGGGSRGKATRKRATPSVPLLCSLFLPISRRCSLSSDVSRPFPLHLSHPGGFHGVRQRRVLEPRFANDTRAPRFPVRAFTSLLSFRSNETRSGGRCPGKAGRRKRSLFRESRPVLRPYEHRSSSADPGIRGTDVRRAFRICTEGVSRGREPDEPRLGHAIATNCNCK